MTANDNRTRSPDNSGDEFTGESGAVSDPNAQEILEYLENVESCTFDELQGATRLPHSFLKQLLRRLEAQDLVDRDQGFHEVRLARSGPPVATDGGQPVGADLQTFEGLYFQPESFFEVLCNERRRRSIRLLGAAYKRERSKPADDRVQYFDVGQLATVLSIAATDGTGVDQDTRESLYVTLVQQHLPILKEHGLLSYYERAKKVEPLPSIEKVAELLAMIDESVLADSHRPADSLVDTLLEVEE
jgi:DNA-binding transcriptional ArsR family regulator